MKKAIPYHATTFSTFPLYSTRYWIFAGIEFERMQALTQTKLMP